MYQITIQDKIQTRVKHSKRSVFLRSAFADIAGYDQVGRGLRNLVRAGLLMNMACMCAPESIVLPET